MWAALKSSFALAVIGPLFVVSALQSGTGGGGGASDVAVAVIVNARNTSPEPTREELRAILTLKRQFWNDGSRIVLIMPPTGSAEKSLLLDTVYHLSDAELRTSWANRLFAGEIVAVPTSVRSPEARVDAVRRAPGAVAVVPASAVTPDVRVLAFASPSSDSSAR
jgi:ABC-type phosphate transport system substrate-binding protein